MILMKKVLFFIFLILLTTMSFSFNLGDIITGLDIDNFIENGHFKGDICFYEYYYLKALMYNNFVLEFGNTLNDFVNIYEKIIDIKPDKLLKQIFNNSYHQKNYKYIFYQ